MNPYYTRYYTFIKPIFRNKHMQNYSSFGFSLLLIMMFSVLAIRPTVSTIISLHKSINQQKEILKQLNVKADNLTAGNRNYQNMNDLSKKTLEGLIPDNADVIGLVNILNSLARSTQASVSGIQLQPIELTSAEKTKKPTLEELHFTFNLSGSYRQTLTFLNLLKSSSRLLTINTLGISSRETGDLVINVNGKAYVLR